MKLAELVACSDEVSGTRSRKKKTTSLSGLIERTTDTVEAPALLERALGDGHEGVMARGPNSQWEAGSRGNSWFKLEPSWTLDLVVLACSGRPDSSWLGRSGGTSTWRPRSEPTLLGALGRAVG